MVSTWKIPVFRFTIEYSLKGGNYFKVKRRGRQCPPRVTKVNARLRSHLFSQGTLIFM